MSMGLPKRTALMLVDDREGHLGSGADIRRGSVDAVITTDAGHAFLAALAEHRSEADMLHEVELGEVGELLLAEPALHAEHPMTHRAGLNRRNSSRRRGLSSGVTTRTRIEPPSRRMARSA